MRSIVVIEFDEWISQNDADRLRAAWKMALDDPEYPLILSRAHVKLLYIPDDGEIELLPPEDAERLGYVVDKATGKNDIAGA